MTMKTKMLTGAMAVALLAGGCAKKVGGQVVAVVNGQEITQQELNAELNGATIPPSADKKEIMAQLLQRVIDRKLLVGKAKAEKLDQSPTYLSQVQRGQDAVLIDLLANKLSKGMPVPDAQAANKFMAENPTLFAGRKRYQLDQLVFAQRDDPVLAKKLQTAKTLEAVEAALKETGVEYKKGKGVLDSAALPPAIAAKIASLPAGDAFLVPENGQVVANVIRGSEAVEMPEQQALPAATGLMRRQALEASMRKQVETERATAKIEYGAGFAPPKKPATTPKP